MSIQYDENTRRFHLSTKNSSYIFQIVGNGHLEHIHWGLKLRSSSRRTLIELEDFNSFSPNTDLDNKTFSLDTMPREFPDFGRSDFRSPAFIVRNEDGNGISALTYEGYEIVKGKPRLIGLPATYGTENQVETLNVFLRDDLTGLKVTLQYSVFEALDVLTRSVLFENTGVQTLNIERAYSMSVDFYQDRNFELIHLPGSWARERHETRTPIGKSTHIIDSKRGASSHQQNPLMILVRPETNEFQGEAFGVNFVYSGSFAGVVEVGAYDSTRLQMGLNDFDFNWQLNPKSMFQTPEVVMNYSACGLNQLSGNFHKLYRNHLCRGNHQHTKRPVLINNWEATYFTFNEHQLKALAYQASLLGIELFVLDDGWFGERNSDQSGLGDWFVNENKLPGGLKNISEYVHQLGMQFGLWFEPEMVSPNSKLYEAHPDWCLHVPGRSRSEGRNQLVLDISRQDVRDYLEKVIGDVLRNNPIDYVKWDMNRHMTEVGSALLPANRQQEVTHLYMLGLYELLEKITSTFPNILFESCSGGGGRFDPGMLYYMPQTWTSDDTDAHERVKIQHSTSLAYPPVTMGAHVSVTPNHQVGRLTPLETRGHIAMAGNLGYELDVTSLPEAELMAMKSQIAHYKDIRETVQFGDFYRLHNPYTENTGAWMSIAQDGSEVIVTYYRGLKEPNKGKARLKLFYLDPAACYMDQATKEIYNGDELMILGVTIAHMTGDYRSCQIHLKKISSLV